MCSNSNIDTIFERDQIEYQCLLAYSAIEIVKRVQNANAWYYLHDLCNAKTSESAGWYVNPEWPVIVDPFLLSDMLLLSYLIVLSNLLEMPFTSTLLFEVMEWSYITELSLLLRWYQITTKLLDIWVTCCCWAQKPWMSWGCRRAGASWPGPWRAWPCAGSWRPRRSRSLGVICGLDASLWWHGNCSDLWALTWPGPSCPGSSLLLAGSHSPGRSRSGRRCLD